MKHKLCLFVFLIGVASGEHSTSVGSSVTTSSTTTDFPAAPVLEDDLPLTFKVVTTKTEAPATTQPPFVTAKPSRTLHLVTGRTDSPAASPDSTGNLDEVVPVAARPPAETMRIVTGRSTVTPSPNSGTTTSPSLTTPPSITRGPSTATTPTPISPTKSAISSPSAVPTVNSASSPSPASVTDTASSSSTETTKENTALGTSTTSSSVKSTSSMPSSSGAHSTAGQDDALDLAAKRDQKEISDSPEVTKNDGNFRDVVSSTAVKSNAGAGSTEESVRNGTTNVSSHVLSTGSTVTNSKSSGGSVKLSSSSTETINDNGSEGDAQPNRLDSNTGSRAVFSTVLSLLAILQTVV